VGYSSRKMGHQDFLGAMFIGMLAVTHWIHIQRLSPENKEGLPYISLQANYRNEKQSLTYIWLLVISLDISFSVLHEPFSGSVSLSFSFLPCHPLLPTTIGHYLTTVTMISLKIK
jgi:hypothetical protein